MSSRVRMLLLYGVPTLSILFTGDLGSWSTVTLVWPIAFSIMGIGCVVNASRCGRVHCYFTGPLFLLAGLASLLHGLRIVDLGSAAWEWIRYGTFAGALLLYFLSERIWGPYFKNPRGA